MLYLLSVSVMFVIGQGKILWYICKTDSLSLPHCPIVIHRYSDSASWFTCRYWSIDRKHLSLCIQCILFTLSFLSLPQFSTTIFGCFNLLWDQEGKECVTLLRTWEMARKVFGSFVTTLTSSFFPSRKKIGRCSKSIYSTLNVVDYGRERLLQRVNINEERKGSHDGRLPFMLLRFCLFMPVFPFFSLSIESPNLRGSLFKLLWNGKVNVKCRLIKLNGGERDCRKTPVKGLSNIESWTKQRRKWFFLLVFTTSLAECFGRMFWQNVWSASVFIQNVPNPSHERIFQVH